MALEGIIQAAEKQGIDKSTILNDIQKKYAKYVKDRQQFYEIESLQEMTGVKPDEKLIQETYSNYIKGFSISYDDKALDDIKELIKITEIKPKFPPEEDIQAIYAGCIREGKLDCIEKLEKITRIKLKVPPEKKIQQTYMEYLKVDYSGKGWDSDGAATLEKIDKIAELEKITGIKFKIPPEEKIQQTY
ncbi:MAG: hypothetical protein NTZ02_01285, partial [Candidatus Woesearchaeota archaeon]|nr:hypothetical protein [Candidatus Woesearchaeota archaeon]